MAIDGNEPNDALRMKDKEDKLPPIKYSEIRALIRRRDDLLQRASKLIDVGILTDAGTKILEEGFESIEQKLLVLNYHSDGESATQASIQVGHGLKEPLQLRAKGYGKRRKGGKEKAAKRSRRCNGCGLTGQLHDKRNCPKLLNMSSQDARLNDDDEYDDGNYID